MERQSDAYLEAQEEGDAEALSEATPRSRRSCGTRPRRARRLAPTARPTASSSRRSAADGARDPQDLRDIIAVARAGRRSPWAITYYIFQEQRLRIPILEEKPFELKAEFETAQAVVPGQGQTVRVAGVRVGDVAEVELEDGVGVVTFAIDREFLPIYKDATILMRPTTGLKDMFFQLDPGSPRRASTRRATIVPVSNTAPDVNLDEVLEALDSDTQAYLRLLLVGAGKGLEGRDKDLGEVLGGLGPINEDLRKLNSQGRRAPAERAHAWSTTSTCSPAASPRPTTTLSSSCRPPTRPWARSPSRTRACAARSQLLGPTLDAGRGDAQRGRGLRGGARPGLQRPAAVRPQPRRGERLARDAGRARRPRCIENEIRPFVRAARKPVPDLRRAADCYSSAAPRLTVVGKKLNRLTNMAANNPDGAEATGGTGRTATRASCSGPAGWATTATCSSTRPTATARSAGSTSPRAATSW